MPSSWSRSNWPSTQGALAGGVFSLTLLDDRPGFIAARIDGEGAEEAFEHESGGHRWQRVPPTEKRGRVQTSTVTVVVLPIPSQEKLKLAERDIRWTACRGSGAGGQKRNKTESAVQVTHIPTGLSVRCESERSQHQNKANAIAILMARLQAQQKASRAQERDASRREQAGSGMRGDKRRTIRVRDGIVTDHVLGRRWQLTAYLRGDYQTK